MIRRHRPPRLRPDGARHRPWIGGAETVRETNQPRVEIQSHLVRRYHLRAGVRQRIHKFQHPVRVIQRRRHIAKCLSAHGKIRHRHAPARRDAVVIIQTPAHLHVQGQRFGKLHNLKTAHRVARRQKRPGGFRIQHAADVPVIIFCRIVLATA